MRQPDLYGPLIKGMSPPQLRHFNFVDERNVARAQQPPGSIAAYLHPEDSTVIVYLARYPDGTGAVTSEDALHLVDKVYRQPWGWSTDTVTILAENLTNAEMDYLLTRQCTYGGRP